ncbi:MAG: glutamyl-tRNA reductase [Chloroflexi bacterium]|nr:glutamyl-tRNA reductase [Chloroflexota bacterium]
MYIWMLGLNHRTAPVALRERLAWPPEILQQWLADLADLLPERAILSTCNRFELYAVSTDPHLASQAFRRLLKAAPEVDWAEVEPALYRRIGLDAARHLFRVAAGLDSMILGEPEILGQVAGAYDLARQARAVGPYLSHMFQEALRMGKQARETTDIGRAPASVGSAAVHLLRQEVPDLAQRRALVVGAGAMARTAARYLRDLGLRDLAVVNRTLARAQALADEVVARVFPWQDLVAALAWADVAVVAVAAPQPVITPEVVRAALAQRPGPRHLVDIGVPRNIATEVATLPQVRLYDIDALQGIVDEGLARRQRAVPQVEALVHRAVQDFNAWLQSRRVAPTLAALRQQAEDLRQQVLRRTLRRYTDRTVDPEVLDEVTRILVEKWLQIPARNLHRLAREGRADPYDAVLRRLFELEQESR